MAHRRSPTFAMPAPAKLNLLQSLKVLLDTRNLTHAADRLGMTQSAMSRHLAQLRQEFQDPLLLREGQRYVLTERAQELQAQLEPLLESIERLYQPPHFDPTSCQREFTFAGSDYLAEYMLPDIMERVMPQAPQLRLSFTPWQAGRFHILVDQAVDLVATIATQVPDNLYGKSLGQDKPVCVMAADHPLRERGALTLDDYLAWSHAQLSSASDKDSFIEPLLARAGRQRDVRLSTPYFVSAVSIVARSRLLLILPEHLAAHFTRLFPLCARPLAFTDHTYHYWLLWHARVDKDPAHRWFRGQVFDVLYHSIHGVTRYADLS